MKWWQAILHVLVGAAAGAGSAYIAGPNVNPLLAAAIGSALSSLGSAGAQGKSQQ